jgi:hypothetical protein
MAADAPSRGLVWRRTRPGPSSAQTRAVVGRSDRESRLPIVPVPLPPLRLGVEITCRVYKPRQPRESPLYRLVEQHLEELLRVWPARFLTVLA